jgi:hypothetical protein
MIKKECFYTTNNNIIRVISMDMRGNFDLGSLKKLSEKKEGRQLLEELTRNKEASLVMLQDEALLSTVIRYEEFSVEMTIAHCLVFGGDEEIRMRLAKMPARILELKTGGRDKVVEFLIAHGSTNVKEVLAENPAALGIICGEALSESGHMEVLYGLKARVMDSERAKMLRGNCIAGRHPRRFWRSEMGPELVSESFSRRQGRALGQKERAPLDPNFRVPTKPKELYILNVR